MTYLLDTSVVSELRRSRCDPRVSAWFDGVAPQDLFLSAIVVGEVRRGIDRLAGRDPQQARLLDIWLGELETVFAGRLMPVDAAVADAWGRLSAGTPVPVEDGLMAATALVHDMTFVTRNVAHVAHTGVRVLDPWAAG